MNNDTESPQWRDFFDGRQQALIRNCRKYAQDSPAGLPGHNLMLIISRMADLLEGADIHPLPAQVEAWTRNED